MTTRLIVDFPLGRYHGTAWGRHPNEGITDFPPSLWRILRALYSSWKQFHPQLPDADVHGLLESLATTPRYLVPDFRLAHTRHYLPDVKHQPPVAVATDLQFDNFAVLDRNSDTGASRLVVEWDIDLAPGAIAAFQALTDGVRFLGRAESVCDMTASTGHQPLTINDLGPGQRLYEPADGTTVDTEVLCPDGQLSLDALTATPSDVRRKSRRSIPAHTAWIPYTASRAEAEARTEIDYTQPSGVFAIRWTLSAPKNPTLKNALVVAELTRRAANIEYGHRARRLGISETSHALSGKTRHGQLRNDGHQHAHFFAFSRDQRRQPSAPIDTVVAYAPGGFTVADLEALLAVRAPTRIDWDKTINERSRLVREAMGPLASVAPELCGPSQRWTSATPFVPSRYRKREPLVAFLANNLQIEAQGRATREGQETWLAPHADSLTITNEPEPQGFRFRTHRITGANSRAKAPPSFTFSLEFAEPVVGPVTLGRHAHLGMGLFLPAPAAP